MQKNPPRKELKSIKIWKCLKEEIELSEKVKGVGKNNEIRTESISEAIERTLYENKALKKKNRELYRQLKIR